MNAGASDPALTERKQQLLDLTGAFCDAHLNADYKRLCKKAIERLAKLRPSPILRGKPEIWASGIVHALGSLNFLFDKSFAPAMSAGDIAAYFGVASGSSSQKATTVRDALQLAQLDPGWMTKHMRESFSSTFEMMDQLNALMAAEDTAGDIALLGRSEGGSPLSLLNTLMQQGGQIAPPRTQDSRENGEFIAHDSPASTPFYDLAERYEAASGSTKSLERKLRGLIALDPEYYDPYLMLRDLLTKTGREEEGAALLDEAYHRALTRITDANGAWPASLEWGWLENRHILRVLLNQALADWTAGSPNTALGLFRKLLRSSPGDNIGGRYYLLAILMGETFEGYETKFMSRFGYDALKADAWFNANTPRFPEDFDWWKQAVGYKV